MFKMPNKAKKQYGLRSETMNSVTFAGIQMPCTLIAKDNLSIILDAIEDLKDHKQTVYLVTPEAALTGYQNYYSKDQIEEMLAEIADCCNRNNAGCFVGTAYFYNDKVYNGSVIISTDGKIIARRPKIYLIEHDNREGFSFAEKFEPVILPEVNIKTTVLICNDFWGGPLALEPSLPVLSIEKDEPHLLIHQTNGTRGSDKNIDKLYWKWHESHLEMISWYFDIPVISVDNLCGMTGNTEISHTSSPSNVFIKGNKIIDVPANAPCIFEHTFNLSELEFAGVE